jgi:hypothetical protein
MTTKPEPEQPATTKEQQPTTTNNEAWSTMSSQQGRQT